MNPSREPSRAEMGAVDEEPAGPRRGLAEELAELAAAGLADGSLTLNRVFRDTEGRGLYLFMVMLCLPFVTPITLPGFSNVFGVVLLLLAVRITVGMPPLLPAFMGDRPLPAAFPKVLRASGRVVRFLERWVRPRHSPWLRWPVVRSLNGFVIAWMAALLALPVPPVVPLSNTLPGYAILILSLSMMEEDGRLIWVGYLVSAFTVGYFVVWADVVVSLAVKYYEPVLHWLHRWL